MALYKIKLHVYSVDVYSVDMHRPTGVCVLKYLQWCLKQCKIPRYCLSKYIAHPYDKQDNSLYKISLQKNAHDEFSQIEELAPQSSALFTMGTAAIIFSHHTVVNHIRVLD